MLFKLGRRPAIHNRRTMRSALALFKALAPLGSPPTVSTDYVSAVMKQSPGGFGMDLNDSLGDCVIADSAHQVMLHTANAGTIVIPTDQDVLEMYSAVGGYIPGNPSTDQGCDETAACQYLESTGLCGQKSAGTAMVDPTNLDHIRWTVEIFGACRLGIVVDQQMEDEFSAKEPWTIAADPNDSTAGGHDVPIVQYDSQYAYVVTWGGLQPVAWSLIANSAFLDECHAEVFTDFIGATGTTPGGFDLATLMQDLQALQESA
jgi:hypothetical protein